MKGVFLFATKELDTKSYPDYKAVFETAMQTALQIFNTGRDDHEHVAQSSPTEWVPERGAFSCGLEGPSPEVLEQFGSLLVHQYNTAVEHSVTIRAASGKEMLLKLPFRAEKTTSGIPPFRPFLN